MIYILKHFQFDNLIKPSSNDIWILTGVSKCIWEKDKSLDDGQNSLIMKSLTTIHPNNMFCWFVSFVDFEPHGSYKKNNCDRSGA